ncbi:hypothetical protein GOP47_0015825 [Adiantum capillus-veneris]|uniref:Uncharacterized protein n=1 Tax=Adiantum capillus-veneris TaxID=13818 RepID=A0A9D4UL09_ADICA|nr:hypothetical protein GOP47_0015825 [Adiantum capillus-veneris]
MNMLCNATSVGMVPIHEPMIRRHSQDPRKYTMVPDSVESLHTQRFQACACEHKSQRKAKSTVPHMNSKFKTQRNMRSENTQKSCQPMSQKVVERVREEGPSGYPPAAPSSQHEGQVPTPSSQQERIRSLVASVMGGPIWQVPRSFSTPRGRRDFRGGDLRERLQRRHSPHSKRLSPGRDSRGRQDRRQSHSRSPLRGRSSRSASPAREKKRQRHDDSVANLSDVSGELKDQTTWTNGSADKNSKSQSPDPLDILEDELQDVDGEIEALNERLIHYQGLIDDKTKLINDLSAKNTDLDAKMQREHEESKRCNSKLKKFLKLHLRCIRAQEEVKKTQARLQKLVEDLPVCDSQRLPTVGEDSDVNIVSDGDGTLLLNHNPLFHDSQTNVHAVKYGGDTEGLFNQKTTLQGKLRAMKTNRVEVLENGVSKEAGHGPDFCTPLGKSVVSADKGKVLGMQSEDILPKVRMWDPNSTLPSTGLAAHADDDMDNDDDKLPGSDAKHNGKTESHTMKLLPVVVNSGRVASTIPQVLSMAPTQYAQYEGDDEEVDVEETEDDVNKDGASGKPLFPIT